MIKETFLSEEELLYYNHLKESESKTVCGLSNAEKNYKHLFEDVSFYRSVILCIFLFNCSEEDVKELREQDFDFDDLDFFFVFQKNNKNELDEVVQTELDSMYFQFSSSCHLYKDIVFRGRNCSIIGRYHA